MIESADFEIFKKDIYEKIEIARVVALATVEGKKKIEKDKTSYKINYMTKSYINIVYEVLLMRNEELL